MNRIGGEERALSLRYRHISQRPLRQTASLGVWPTGGAATPVTKRIPLRARSALRSTSFRTRSSVPIGAALCWVAGLSGLHLELQGQPPHFPVELTNLDPQPLHVGPGGQVREVPQPACEP